MYSVKDIEDICSKYLEENGVSSFYNCGAVNYAGSSEGLKYTEIVAGFVLDNIKEFDNIKSICREKNGRSYNSKHNGKYNSKSTRKEELDAIIMFNQCRKSVEQSVGDIGCVIDYQIPLKNEQRDKAGKIDLLSQKDNTVYILELKKYNSHESLLRCVLEGYTYLKTVEKAKEKLLTDFSLDCDDIKDLKTAPLVFDKGYPYRDYIELKENKRPKLKELMKVWGVDHIFVCDKSSGKYTTKKMIIE